MGKDWKDVKAMIEAEIDHIWFDEPEEVTMSKLGVYPSGAGTKGQYLGNLFFLTGDSQAMGWWTIEPAMYCILRDNEFSLKQCKQMFVYLNHEMANLMGGQYGEGCPYPWLNLLKFWTYTLDMEDSFDSITTKEDLRCLLWSWFNYVDRINRWFYTVYPWELGQSKRRVDAPYLDEVAKLQGLKVVKE